MNPAQQMAALQTLQSQLNAVNVAAGPLARLLLDYQLLESTRSRTAYLRVLTEDALGLLVLLVDLTTTLVMINQEQIAGM